MIHPRQPLYHAKRRRAMSFGRLFFFLRLLFILMLFGGVAGGAVYGLFFASWARVATVEVQGTQILHEEDIASAAYNTLEGRKWNILPLDSFLLFPRAELAQQIQKAFPRISSLSIDSPSAFAPAKATIHIQERAIEGIWCQGAVQPSSSCAFFDDTGVIFDRAPSATQGRLFWVLEDMRAQDSPELSAKVLQDDTMHFLQVLRKDLASLFGTSLLSWRIEQSGEVHVRVTDGADIFGWYIYFSPAHDAAYQVRVLKRVLEEEIGKEKRPYLEYIDLRVQNKVFYKLH